MLYAPLFSQLRKLKERVWSALPPFPDDEESKTISYLLQYDDRKVRHISDGVDESTNSVILGVY